MAANITEAFQALHERWDAIFAREQARWQHVGHEQKWIQSWDRGDVLTWVPKEPAQALEDAKQAIADMRADRVMRDNLTQHGANLSVSTEGTALWTPEAFQQMGGRSVGYDGPDVVADRQAREAEPEMESREAANEWRYGQDAAAEQDPGDPEYLGEQAEQRSYQEQDPQSQWYREDLYHGEPGPDVTIFGDPTLAEQLEYAEMQQEEGDSERAAQVMRDNLANHGANLSVSSEGTALWTTPEVEAESLLERHQEREAAYDDGDAASEVSQGSERCDVLDRFQVWLDTNSESPQSGMTLKELEKWVQELEEMRQGTDERQHQRDQDRGQGMGY